MLSNEEIVYVKKGGQEFIQFKKLLQYSNIISHAYSIGIDKNYRTFKPDRSPLLNEDYKKNINDYKTLCDVNGLNYKNLIKAMQNHTDNVICVNSISNNETIDSDEIADGLITNTKDIVLSTTNADCILLLMLDPIKNVIANIHSGWKGTLQEISVKAVKKMVEKYECNPKDIIVCICPSIRKCHFEVDKDVYELFYDRFEKLGNINSFIQKSNKEQKWYIDTILINKIILKQIGILEENIVDSGICSVCNKDYVHSYRAEGKSYGLSTAIISLK